MSAVPRLPDDIDIAVISHNGRQTLPRVLECLRSCGATPDRITLFDIASTDDTLSWLRREWPAIRIERFERNDGPNLARNRALEKATRRFVLLVDSDAFLRPMAIVALREAMVPEDAIGMTVPVVVHDDRQEVIQYAGASLHFICEAINPWSGHTLGERGDGAGDVGTAPGVTMLIDADAARRVGRFDARYFMGKEDGEFCYRLRLGGYRIIEVPRAIAAHGSRKRTTWLYRYQLRNRWHFMLKNYEIRTLLVLAPALLLHELLQLGVLLFQGEFYAWRHGVVALFRWLPTLRRERSVLRTVRVVHDKHLLAAAPLMVRDEIAGGSVGGTLKKAYDVWLAFYWRLARLFLS